MVRNVLGPYALHSIDVHNYTKERNIQISKHHYPPLEVSFVDFFRGIDWRRTRIILVCNYRPQIVGVVLSVAAP
ncbi:hypothetical protein VTI74DRAFT_8156 [Chaetomium olivicolor]